ncbi:MAG: hypothetical protein ACE5OS_03840 [Anaerolineae bacterium]
MVYPSKMLVGIVSSQPLAVSGIEEAVVRCNERERGELRLESEV